MNAAEIMAAIDEYATKISKRDEAYNELAAWAYEELRDEAATARQDLASMLDRHALEVMQAAIEMAAQE